MIRKSGLPVFRKDHAPTGRRIRVAFRRVSMTALYVRGLAALRPLYWLAGILFVAALSSRALLSVPKAEEPIVVRLDEAKIIKVPDRATTIVIGNPLIADLALQPGGLAVVAGRSFGATNVLVMDKSGAILTEQTVQ